MQAPDTPAPRWLSRDLAWLGLIFCVAYCARLADFSLSIDDEIAALGDAPTIWLLDGRWLAYLIFRFVLPQPVVPAFPVILFGLSGCLSYAMLLRALGVQRLGAIHYLAFPLYIAFPTWIAQAAFATNMAVVGLAQWLVVAAASTIQLATRAADGAPPRKSPAAVAILWSGLLVAMALGIYQSFALAFVVIGLALALFDGFTGDGVRRLAVRGASLVAALFVGVVVDAAASAALRTLAGAGDSTRIRAMFHFDALFDAPLAVLHQAASQMLSVYDGGLIDAGITAIGIPLVIATGLCAIAKTAAPPARKAAALALALLLLVLPFVPSLFTGGFVPLRTLVGVGTVVSMLALAGLASPVRWVHRAALVATCLCVFHLLYFANLVESARRMARLHDQALAAAIHARIVDSRPAAGGSMKVDFFGGIAFTTHFPRVPNSPLGYSFFEWDGGNLRRIQSYMRVIGYADIAPPTQAERVADLDTFAQMPVWPARDSVRTVGDVTLVKLGPTRGYFPDHLW